MFQGKFTLNLGEGSQLEVVDVREFKRNETHIIEKTREELMSKIKRKQGLKHKKCLYKNLKQVILQCNTHECHVSVIYSFVNDVKFFNNSEQNEV